jgi:hypothetical protein
MATAGTPSPRQPSALPLPGKAAGAFNELQANELRAWADVRNTAAHGEFEKFNCEQVEAMVTGVGRFMAQYLG